MNINMLMQQAKKMQNDMEKAKEEVSKKTFTAKQPLKIQKKKIQKYQKI